MDKQSVMPVYGPERLNDRDLDDLLRYLTGARARTDAARQIVTEVRHAATVIDPADRSRTGRPAA